MEMLVELSHIRLPEVRRAVSTWQINVQHYCLLASDPELPFCMSGLSAELEWVHVYFTCPDTCRYVISDWACPGLEHLLTTIAAGPTNARRQQLRALANILSREWECWEGASLFSASYTVQLTTKAQRSTQQMLLSPQKGSGGASKTLTPSAQQQQQQLSAGAVSYLPGGTLPSSLLLSLQQLPWLVSDKGEAHIPSQLFQPDPYVKDLFRDKVQYVAAELPPAMASRLGIRGTTSPEMVLDVLLEWSQQASMLRSGAAAASLGDKTSGCGIVHQQQQLRQELGAPADRKALPANAARPAAEAAAAEGSPMQCAGFKASLEQMNKIYSYLAGMIGYERLPDDGYQLLRRASRSNSDSGGGDVANAQERVSANLTRLLACEMFEKHSLIWLPDREAIAAALEEAAQHRGRHVGDSKHRKQSRQPGAGVAADTSSVMALLHDQELMGQLASRQLQGAFYDRGSLRFQDDAGVIEQLPSMDVSSENLAATAVGLRVMEPYYPSLMQVFSAVYLGPDIPQLQRYLPPNARFAAGSWVPLVGMHPTVR